MNIVQILRKERSMTQENLADMVGISREYLSNVERQLAMPSVELAMRISNALSVDVDQAFLTYRIHRFPCFRKRSVT